MSSNSPISLEILEIPPPVAFLGRGVANVAAFTLSRLVTSERIYDGLV